MPSTCIAAPKDQSAAPRAQSASTTGEELLRAVANAIENAGRGMAFTQDIGEASMLLASLPLTTEEFGLATNRLKNANRYVASGEFGAARWELATLRNELSRQE